MAEAAWGRNDGVAGMGWGGVKGGGSWLPDLEPVATIKDWVMGVG